MLLHFLLQNCLLTFHPHLLSYISHLKVSLIFLQLHQFAGLDPPLLIQPLQHPVYTPLGHYENLVLKFQVAEVESQFGHHLLQQLHSVYVLDHQTVQIKYVEIDFNAAFMRIEYQNFQPAHTAHQILPHQVDHTLEPCQQQTFPDLIKRVDQHLMDKLVLNFLAVVDPFDGLHCEGNMRNH